MSLGKWMERALEAMAYAWRLALDEDYCLLADFLPATGDPVAFPGANARPSEPEPAWSSMVKEMRAQRTRLMARGALTNLINVRQPEARAALTRKMPVGGLTSSMPAPAEYPPDPPALLAAYEPDLTLLFDSQRVLFPENEIGPFFPPEALYEN